MSTVMRDKVIAEAAKWVGYLEKKSDYMLEDFTANAGSNNYTIFAKKYCNYGFGAYNVYQPSAWCAEYVTVVFYDALGYNTAGKIIQGFAYCPYGVNYWKSIGRWHDRSGYTPQPGDVIFFQSSGVASHTGIVYKVSGNTVYTYEGNTSSGSEVIPNGGACCAKSYSISNSRILGYGNPNWALIENVHYGEEYYNILNNKGLITNDEIWKDYDAPSTKSQTVALLDKITGGTWPSEEANTSIHWVQPMVISLCGKKIITDKDQWLTFPDIPISKALVLALIDHATGGTLDKYVNRKVDHWSRNNLDSLCDKAIITTPEAWTDFEAQISHAQLMAIMCKAFFK